MNRMASRGYRAKDLSDAVWQEQWDEARRIIRRQPQLVNEQYGVWSLLYWIVFHSPPRDVISESLKSATAEAVDWVNPTWPCDCILHGIASLGYAEEMRQALRISATNVNLQDYNKRETPLHCLLKEDHQFSDHLNITRFLLDAGPDVNVENEDNQTPLDLYKENECKKYKSINREKQKKEVLHLLQNFEVPEAILARGSEALKVFNEELEDGKIMVNHARLMVTGKEGVGKTCLVNTLLERTFNEEEPSTEGIVLTTAFQTTDISCVWKETENIDECEQIKQIYDNALESKVAEKLKEKGSQAEAAEPVPASAQDSTPVQPEAAKPVPPPVHTTEKSNVLVRVFRRVTKKKGRRKPGTSSTPVLPSVPDPFETKVNDPSQALPSERQKRIIDRMIGKASASTGNEDMTYIWDFAGQQLYYITHRIFLTSEAVYLILFNLMEGMHDKGKCRISKMAKDVMTYDMTNIQIIKYWMRLIFTYAVPVESQLQAHLQAKKPQILVVGTHSESLQGTDDDKKKKIREQFEIIFEEIKGTPYECHVMTKMYAIDNKFPTQTEMLKVLKQDVGGFLKAMPKTVPLKWLEFQRILQENGRTAVRMSYTQVCEVATNCGISVKNLIHTLNYLHDLGIILYFENNKLLKDTVITNPRKLIDIFKKIVTVVEPDDSDKWAAMKKLWNKLDEEGILEEELVRHLWRDELSKDKTSFEVFLELMKQFGLLCEQIKNRESKYRSFFVPCRLKRSKDNVSIERDTAQMVSIYMASEDFIPDSVFHPLVVSLIGMVQDMGYTARLELFSNYANICLGLNHTLSLGPVVIKNKPSLKLEISRMPITQEDGTETPAGEPNPRVCMQVLEFLKREMKVLTSGMKHTRYKFRVLCWTSLQELHFHDLEECLENDGIQCGKKLITTAKLQRMFKNKQLVTDPSMQAADSSVTEAAQPDERLGYLEDSHLLDIAKGMGQECKQLGVRLGLSWNRIQQIWSDNRQVFDSIMDMLTEWRKQQNYETNQVEIMYRALKEQGLTELANKIFGSKMSEVKESNVNSGEHTSGRLPKRHHEHDASLDDQDLLFICEDLGPDWRRLGVRLGLGWNKINVIADNNTLLKDSVMETLVTWRDGQSTNQIEIMINALREQRLVQLAERLCERRGYKDDLDATENLRQVSTEHRLVRGYIPDADLLVISEVMGRGWKAVARSLETTETEIDDVDKKFQNQIVEATLEMLIRWRNRQGRNVNQLTVLKAALIENDNKIAADKLGACYQHT